jgi:hypothetical protein
MREFASALLTLLEVYFAVVAVLYIALAVSAVYITVAGKISDRRRWNRIDREVDSFRAELDRAAADEWRGRAA